MRREAVVQSDAIRLVLIFSGGPLEATHMGMIDAAKRFVDMGHGFQRVREQSENAAFTCGSEIAPAAAGPTPLRFRAWPSRIERPRKRSNT